MIYRGKRTKAPAKILRVTINGEIVLEKNSTETFLACIKTMGADKIASIKDIKARGLPLVVSTKDNRLQLKQLDSKWFVCTHMSTIDKRNMLIQIAKRLGIEIEVEIMESSSV